ncbi:MAG: hypothetical protein H6Q64_2256 [Firmicutes bacterium]|nr:hypothetical protein [Bacillota bacterium]
MRMRKLIDSVLIISISVLMISCSSVPQFALDDKAKNKFSSISGVVGIEFAGPDVGECWKYTIDKGNLLLKEVWSCPPQWIKPEPFYIDIPDEVPQGLPIMKENIYHGPYSYSSDKTLIAISVSPKKNSLNYIPTDFVLIRCDTKEILLQTKNNDEYLTVGSIAWSLDAKYLAILEKKNKILYGFREIIFTLFSHPISEYTYFLSIYDRNGSLLVRSQVAAGLVGGSGRVFWEN